MSLHPNSGLTSSQKIYYIHPSSSSPEQHWPQLLLYPQAFTFLDLYLIIVLSLWLALAVSLTNLFTTIALLIFPKLPVQGHALLWELKEFLPVSYPTGRKKKETPWHDDGIITKWKTKRLTVIHRTEGDVHPVGVLICKLSPDSQCVIAILGKIWEITFRQGSTYAHILEFLITVKSEKENHESSHSGLSEAAW